MEILQIAIILIVFVLLCIPIGRYMYKVSEHKKTLLDPVLDKIDGFIYKLSGIQKEEEMNWKQYIFALLMCNAVPAIIGYIILRIQAVGIFNPNHVKGMEQGLTFNTIISFLTNTNLQDYAGETGASYLSQMIVITFFMFFAAATGIAVALAFIRALSGKKKLGNFYVDLVRITTRILLPLSIIVAIFYIGQGVPQTLSANKTVTTIEGKLQNIPLGPVASLEAIKLIGTNGGGFFSANSSHPFENPTPLTNSVQIITLLLLAGSMVVCFGHMIKKKKQAVAIFAAMMVLLLAGAAICFSAEKAGNPALSRIGLSQSMGNLEGKEERFGIAGSSLFTTVTTDTSCGAVNNMHDSLTPIGGAVPLINMMLNVIFGGVGVGFMNMIMYAILTVFLCGLMVGRTPEFLNKKIEGKEIKLVAFAIIVHPFLILMSSALALTTKQGLAGISNPGFHGLTQVLYQFTSSAANNGSGFEGLIDNTMFWNVSAGVVMFLGRYLSIIILLAVASSFAAKRAVPATQGTFKTDNTIFTVTLIVIIVIIGALTFLPAVALGPISEYLTL
ncbi:K+-transporting ATPase ATPase A chain [Clostridium acetobutylicum]|uniref:Potassium-transporting ATPase potassium-binding subunit n=1 Tax=Clostridium acetobutylicum (strain ATCC 824 / DSM 792 / JCM 1419 / IAM 19013 / LMG 5710 / NBRC 13948 / NRRL B-527 / VKM B-1787 / 2291 / W) TaxID=272562 RepID=KDPA_CLOAB|nr:MULTISPECIES: potassium-transporting ATPase subunit KdpA [Clostridium]O32327.2 RecName: Full=Potassium-transporting ATPase potassium-binding subunit; AltName: Full=ATP phosphohydrolase [potassium-transporting] A chain; AltName: Full=Potassium-binding and translocating subunit A; AltName: Full=Potassium-translocating ATPase A chain [Clostridium acetobutylicum ATCC 824]AAK81603.1 K+-transporting ATPase, a chain [Clostridium acetobutylicum ATCC 824]ADZ22726.1 potassium-transporting ATPase subuni